MRRKSALFASVALLWLAACGGPQAVDGPTTTEPNATTSGGGTTAPDTPVETPPETTEVTSTEGQPETMDTTSEEGDPNDPFGWGRGAELAEAVQDAVARAREGDLASARTDLQQLLGEELVEAYALYGLGVIAFYEGQEASALDYFDQAMSADPTLTDALMAAIRIHLRHDDTQAAQRVLDRQVSASDNLAAVRAGELYIDLYNGRYERVIQDGRSLLLEDSANLDIHFAMGMANFYLERYELADYIMTISIERDASRPDFHFLRALIAQAQGNTSGAENHLSMVLRLDANHPEANNNMGVIELQRRNPDEAAAYFQTAIAHAPEYREAWLNLGNAYKGMQEADQAQQAFEQALEVDPDYADPYFNLGILYLDNEMGDLTIRQRCERAVDYFAEYRERASYVGDDDRVVEYAAQAAECIQREIELAEAEAAAAIEAEEERQRLLEAGTCLDDFGFECFEGDPDCFAPDGSPCGGGGGGGGGGCMDDFGFECFPGDPDCFDGAGNVCGEGGGDTGGGGGDCMDDFGFECFPGDPDCFDADGNVCGGGDAPEAAPEPEADPEPDADPAPAGGGSDECYDDFGFECSPGDPECYDADGNVCGGGGAPAEDRECYDDFGFECSPGDPECYDTAGNPCQ